MTDWDPAAFETALIADMRANGGAVTSGPLEGQPLAVMTTIGAKSGEPRRAILTYTRDGGAYVVAGSNGGSPTEPSWLVNVQADPMVSVEVGGQTFQATASIAAADDRDRLWDAHVAVLPQFAEYPEQSGRVIPMIRLTPTEQA